MKRIIALFSGLVLLLAAGACSSEKNEDVSTGSANEDQITVVATTAIWGSIAQLATTDVPQVHVETIVNSTSADPHEYEPSAQDLAKITDADVLVANGGGYDNWFTDQAAEMAPDIPIISAMPIEEHAHTEGADHESDDHDHEGHSHDTNPHIWFDTHAVEHFTDDLMQQLHSMQSDIPDSAPAVSEKVDALADRIAALAEANVVVTEPVAGYLVEESQLQDVTPEGFSEAINKETEPAAADIAATRDVLKSGDAQVLITNTQSETQATAQLIQAARDEGVAIVNINEMPAEGETYFDYANDAVDQLEDATR
ncbi:MAG: zinc ABC transporter substrate-binding protein [Corynebacterium sp.]|nr:zinc ABC transporter substrate-binding protein [Corynebacterium sp.]